MRLLLDTHVFLWFVSDKELLPTGWLGRIENEANDVHLSVASIWESMIKQRKGKLALREPAETYLPRLREAHGIRSLPIDEASILRLASLPPIHNDPFDRIMVCQALQHDLTLMSVDETVRRYPVKLASF